MDQAGAACDATCDTNGMDANGAACTVTPPTPAPVTCMFDAAGWTCDDGTSCQADMTGATVDETGAAGCNATCSPEMKDSAGMDCTVRRLAVQTMIGQN